MKAFDFNRFLNVARWDLTINRKFYIRQISVIVGCVLVPVILSFLKAIFGYLMTAGSISYSVYKGIAATAFHDIDFYVFYFALINIGTMILMLCYMFHNFTTKQGRISELTLPATNCERFVWHFVCKVFGTWLVLMASAVLADLLHVVLGWIMFGITDPQSITYAIIDGKIHKNLHILEGFHGDSMSRISLMCFIQLLGYCFYSTFSLGSAFKYKHTFGYVLLFHVVFWIVTVLIFGLLAGVFVHSDFDAVAAFCDRIPDWLGHIILNLPALVVLCGMWWLTFRLYCRAQITTRRNP